MASSGLSSLTGIFRVSKQPAQRLTPECGIDRHVSLVPLCPRIYFDVTKILVIDDSKMMRLYLRRCLERAGYEVEDWESPSAMEIPERITASAPDLILCDFQMPGCNGTTVARMAQRNHPKIPLLILTAFHDKEMESNLLRLRVRQVLAKPIEAAALTQAIEDALATPEQVA